MIVECWLPSDTVVYSNLGLIPVVQSMVEAVGFSTNHGIVADLTHESRMPNEGFHVVDCVKTRTGI